MLPILLKVLVDTISVEVVIEDLKLLRLYFGRKSRQGQLLFHLSKISGFVVNTASGTVSKLKLDENADWL